MNSAKNKKSFLSKIVPKKSKTKQIEIRREKAHFSSVPTRMSLFTCKKYVFLIKKIFPPPPHPKIGKTQHNALYESRWKTQHNALYESRWKTVP